MLSTLCFNLYVIMCFYNLSAVWNGYFLIIFLIKSQEGYFATNAD